ncbi:WYL domain-containing protein [Pseudomonas sp. Z4-7]|uniref:WYL domain-containing protein n=1 Tax=Pseudomonas sp. Z4-7 TaxID=2817413 RepID=UPI003DA9247B
MLGPLQGKDHDRHTNRWLLRCELPDTQELRLFLMSNAADVKVVSPAPLRCHVREQLETAVQPDELLQQPFIGAPNHLAW